MLQVFVSPSKVITYINSILGALMTFVNRRRKLAQSVPRKQEIGQPTGQQYPSAFDAQVRAFGYAIFEE